MFTAIPHLAFNGTHVASVSALSPVEAHHLAIYLSGLQFEKLSGTSKVIGYRQVQDDVGIVVEGISHSLAVEIAEWLKGRGWGVYAS